MTSDFGSTTGRTAPLRHRPESGWGGLWTSRRSEQGVGGPAGPVSDVETLQTMRRLQSEYGHTVLAYVSAFVHDRSHAEDVVQQTLAVVARLDSERLADPAAARALLYDAARSVVMDRIRAGTHRGADEPQPDRDDGDVRRLRVLQALSRLSPEHRAALVEVYFRRRSVAEAAAAIGVPVAVVKARLYYALRAVAAADPREGGDAR